MKKALQAFLFVSILFVFTGSLHAEGSLIVNNDNSDAIDSDAITSFLVGKRKFWENGEQVVIAVLKGSPSAEAVLEEYAKMDESRFKSHWQRLAFSGRGTMPKQLDDPAAVIAFVKVNKGAIGILDDSADLSLVKKIN